MKDITDINLLRNLSSQGALFILFGGPACGVCKSLRPQLNAMLEQYFDDMLGVYVDCEASPEICAQYSVFSLPVVKVFIDGLLITEEFGAFSVIQLKQKLERPYSMWISSIHQ